MFEIFIVKLVIKEKSRKHQINKDFQNKRKMFKLFCSNLIIKYLIKAKKLPFSESSKPPPISPEELEKARLSMFRKDNRDFDEITIQKRPTKLPINDTQVKKPTDFYDPKKGPFRESQGVFNFNEPVLNNKP